MQHNAKKSLGQNFLQDQNIIAKIVQAGGIIEGDRVVEIGPGLGAITTHILHITKKIEVIELDKEVIPTLRAKCDSQGELIVHHHDVLKFDFSTLEQQKPLKLMGNLPYNISTPILFHLIPQRNLFTQMVFMLQKELVDRITASHDSKVYGRLSVMVQYYFNCEGLFTIPPSAFIPAPKVDSKILRLTPKADEQLTAKCDRTFATVVKMAFSQRRKTLRNTLKPLLSLYTSKLESVPIDLSLRAENLSVADFISLSNFFTE